MAKQNYQILSTIVRKYQLISEKLNNLNHDSKFKGNQTNKTY